MKARAAATTAPVRARLALAAPRLRLRELLAPRLRLLAARRPRRLARLKAAAAAHTAAVKERARRAAALAVAFRARRAGYAGQLAGAWRTYGWTAVGTHFAVYGTTLAGLTAAVDVGLLGGGRARDEAVAKLSALVAPVAPRALVDGLRSSPTAGAFAVAWVLAKFTEIPRLAVTLALTPRVAAMRSVVRLAVRGVVSYPAAPCYKQQRAQARATRSSSAAATSLSLNSGAAAQGSARGGPARRRGPRRRERVDLARRQAPRGADGQVAQGQRAEPHAVERGHF